MARGILVPLLVLLAGCSSFQWDGPAGVKTRFARVPQGVSAAIHPQAEQHPITALRAYRVGPGDELEVTLKGSDALLGIAIVTTEGRATLPRRGDMAVSGLTLDEIAAAIEADHGGGVSVTLRAAPPIYVFGAVGEAGSVPYTEGLTLGALLERAGGATHRADLRSVSIRPAHASAESTATFDAALPILPGDVVRLSERYF